MIAGTICIVKQHGLHVLLSEIPQCICIFYDSVFSIQIALSFYVNYLNRIYFDSETKLCLIVSDRQRKFIFAQASFYLQGILNNINEQDTCTW